jgi:hypothetical protein
MERIGSAERSTLLRVNRRSELEEAHAHVAQRAAVPAPSEPPKRRVYYGKQTSPHFVVYRAFRSRR